MFFRMRITSYTVFFCITYVLIFKTGFTESRCFYPWITFQKHCYMFGFNKKTWFDSKVECNKYNSYLARVETPAEDNWIIQQILALSKNTARYLWIGGNTLRKVGDWRWESTNEKVGYTFFYPLEPNSPTTERCLCYFSNRKKMLYWGDYICNGKIGFICERDN
ncbi:perlucin-like protein [Ostrea edulis]|uniref:perlucin-like protein n=1 Tax=Ostrea edulis TaxID=37623 RepID=UPI002096574D|nr:perlucin-like protein [Ostrea edulis]